MTTFELKQLRLRNGAIFDYKEHAQGIVRTVPPLDAQGVQKRGFNDDDMGEAETLAEKIAAANGAVELTAAEVMQLYEKVQAFHWPFSDPAFRQFILDVKALKDQ